MKKPKSNDDVHKIFENNYKWVSYVLHTGLVDLKSEFVTNKMLLN